ncbi:MAG TPA: rhamnulokinase [Firmicutes bacterium]|nr:rhamnulokinase [Bacillota bacterium]
MGGGAFLAIDLGASSGRAILATIDGDGRGHGPGHGGSSRMQLEEVHRFPNQPIHLPGGYFWNAPQIYEEIKAGLAKGFQLAAAKGYPLLGAGIDTWGVDYGLITRSGALLGLPRHYRDPRHVTVYDRIMQQQAPEEIYMETGIQFMALNTLYQLLAVQEFESGLLELADSLLMMGALFTYFLTGERLSEETTASTTQFLNPYTRNWSETLLKRFGLPASILPPVVEPGKVVGPLLKSVAEEIGCGGGGDGGFKIILPAVHDTASAVAAVPAEGESWCYLSSGTWSLLGLETAAPVINRQSLAFNITNEGGVFGTTRLLKNVTGLWILQECKRQWDAEGETSWDELMREAAAAPPAGSWLDPDHRLFAAPGDMIGRLKEYYRQTGQEMPATRGSLTRSILESLALKYRYVLNQLETLVGRRCEVIHIVGGGAQNALLNQMTADASGRTVLAGPVEATAIGNALMQAIALRWLDSLADGRSLVRRSFPAAQYQPRETGRWDEVYETFVKLLG